MKKMVVLLLGAVLALGVTGCGQDKKADNNVSSGADQMRRQVWRQKKI
ncbi:hypothetical protein RE628_05605 [Paenibacillus sp. D2_2]|nr:hypothetical protein [Paenibacillus sp. D2_2]WMT41919.1 hypothetical protein RE628_05605 [Paenibacillus sp. D2_2]